MRWIQPVAKIRQSFRAKIFLLVTLVIVILSLSFTISYLYHEQKSQIEELSMEGNLLANILADAVRLPLFAGNIPLLASGVEGLMRYRHVLLGAVFDEAGHLLTETARPGGPGEEARQEMESRLKSVGVPSRRESDIVMVFTAPVVIGVNHTTDQLFDDPVPARSSRTVGYVTIVLDKREMNSRIRAILIVSTIVTVLFLAIGLFFAYYAVRGVTEPLNQLAKGVTALEQGGLATPILVSSKDEVAHLAESFNTMAATLLRREKENRRLEEELRIAQKMEAKEEWERTFDTVPDLIAILDRQENVVRLNRAMAERLKIGKEDAVGRPFAELFQGARLVMGRSGNSADGGDEAEIFEPSLDSYFWLTVSPLHKPDGELAGWVQVARDISERKRSEEEKRAIQAKLIQANKMTSLGLLVSGMAHEVNNPNNSIKLAAHLLTKAWKDVDPILSAYHRESGDFTLGGFPYSEVKGNLPGYITGIVDNSRRIEGIIKNLREFVRKGKSNVSTLTDVNMVVSVSTAILNYHIRKLTSNFSLSLAEDLPMVRGNPQLLEQVVINLVMNAIQSLPAKSCRVEASTFYDNRAGEVVIKVYDEGCGMTEETRRRLFEPFFSTKLESGGTGLGLAISNVIVSEHSGSILFQSVEGEWTAALVRLPAVVTGQEVRNV